MTLFYALNSNLVRLHLEDLELKKAEVNTLNSNLVRLHFHRSNSFYRENQDFKFQSGATAFIKYLPLNAPKLTL